VHFKNQIFNFFSMLHVPRKLQHQSSGQNVMETGSSFQTFQQMQEYLTVAFTVRILQNINFSCVWIKFFLGFGYVLKGFSANRI
jgi:hypothetical protein